MSIKNIITVFKNANNPNCWPELNTDMSCLVLKTCHTSIIKGMKVSVVIPAYNEEEYISKSLKSVMDQVVDADEIIVIDNNSKDRTVEISEKMGATVIRERTQGMIPARNRGFNSAKYDIIARIDADVVVPKNWVKLIKENFGKKKIDALTGPVTLTGSKIIPQSPIPSRVYLESLRIVSNGKRYLQGPNMSLTNDIWQKVKDKVDLDDKRVHEDLDLSFKILKSGGTIGFDKYLTVRASARRLNNKPESFFLEYPYRIVKTFWANKK